MSKGTITRVSGQFLSAEGLNDAGLYDVVRFPHKNTLGEIIGFNNGEATIHLFDKADDIELGQGIVSDNGPITIELGPGLLGKAFDGIGRPLSDPSLPGLDRDKLWDFKPCVNVGDEVSGGDVLGTVEEDEKITHKILVPPSVSGTIRAINEKPSTLTDVVVAINGNDNALHEISIMHKWPIRSARPYGKKLLPAEPIITLQRAIDSIYPIAKGSVTAICGGYGTGKTTLEFQIAGSVDVDVLVYVGCGERGNEMLRILDLFSSKGMSNKSVIVATTADMTPAMREASLYSGVTIAEYYRDMGCNVVLIADSLCVWQDSLVSSYPDHHEISPYLAKIYERVGRVSSIGNDSREGTITFIASSDRHPDPATERSAKVMLTLDTALAEKRQFPAIDAFRSYSLYAENTREWFNKTVNDNWAKFSSKFTELLGLAPDPDIDKSTLSDSEKLIDRTVATICNDFIAQNAYEEQGGCSLDKQYKYMRLIYDYYRLASKTLDDGAPVEALTSVTSLDEIAVFKHTEDKELGSAYRAIIEHLNSDIQKAATREEGR